jgi:hypothetical protein
MNEKNIYHETNSVSFTLIITHIIRPFMNVYFPLLNVQSSVSNVI